MATVIGLRCVLCGRDHAPGDGTLVCPRCGDDGTLDVEYDLDEARGAISWEALRRDGDRSMWRYRALLPVGGGERRLPLRVGGTPLVPAERLARALGLRALHVKDEGRNPSASLKDRASAIAVALAVERGASAVACASTGNAASSLATLAAAAGVRSVIFLPESAPPAKLAQLLAHGAALVRVRASYDTAFDLAARATAAHGYYPRNTGTNPYLSEGKKTAAFEIAEDLGGRAPDRVYAAVGDGCIFGALYKGFHELVAVGLLDRMPALVGVQAEGAAPIARAFASGGRPEPMEPETLADSISVGRPRDWAKALRAARESGGAIRTVPDAEIVTAIRALAREAGIFAEPAGAAGYAGLVADRREGLCPAGATAVVLVTGSGLKDPGAVARFARAPEPIAPERDAVEARLRELGLAG